MTTIYVCGVGMTAFGRHPEKTIKDLTRESVTAALEDANAAVAEVEAAYFTASTTGHLQGQIFVPGQIALRSMGFEEIPMYNVENACASGSSAFALACQALRSGDQDVVLAVGAEKMFIDDKNRMFSVFDGGWDVSKTDENRDRLLALGQGLEIPVGTSSPKPYSVFMDVYAAFARLHMRSFGTTQAQIAAVSAKNHLHSVHNERAQFRGAYTVEEILSAPPITYPLTLPMCAPMSDGSAAALLCTQEGLRKIGADGARAIRVLGTVTQTGSSRDAADYRNHITAVAARKLYDKTGFGPMDVDVVEVHDATAVGEIIQAENLQLADFGEAGPAAERGDFTIGGRVPINPSGGLESKGHPIGATGLGQLFELVTQLRGEAGARQVEGARIAVQENGGGLYGYEEAVAVLSMLTSLPE